MYARNATAGALGERSTNQMRAAIDPTYSKRSIYSQTER